MTQVHEERATQPAPDLHTDVSTVAPAETPFNKPGDRVVGIITRPPGIGEYYGERCVTLTVTNMGRDTTLYVHGSFRGALLHALRKAGVARPEVGGRIWACYVGDGELRDGQLYRPKFIKAVYTPPGIAPTYARRRAGERRG